MKVLQGKRSILRRVVFVSAVMFLYLQEALVAALSVVRVEKHDKYLGLPMEVRYSKVEAFNYLKEKVQRSTIYYDLCHELF